MKAIDNLKKNIPSLEEVCTQIEKSPGYLFLSEYFASLTELQKIILNNTLFLVAAVFFFGSISAIYGLKSGSKNSAIEKMRAISLIDNFHRENIDNTNKIKQLRYVEMKQRFPSPEQMIQELVAGLNIPPGGLHSDTQILKSNSAYEKVVTQVQINKTNLNIVVQILHRIESIAGNLMVNDLSINADPADATQLNTTISFIYYQKIT